MAQYTLLNFDEIQIILSRYTHERVQLFNILSGGSENTNYLVKTKGSSFVLTICEQKSLKKASELASLLVHLNENNFKTSILAKAIDGALITSWNNKPTMLKRYIEGAINENLSDDLLTYLGKELATLHDIEAPSYISKELAYGIEHFNEVQIYAADSEFSTWLKNTQVYIEGSIDSRLPKALIHSDIFYNNIIVNSDEKTATIMDFEEACHYYRIFDIGMMLIGTCAEGTNLNLSKLACLLKGYQKKIALLPIEINALQAFTVYGATATAFWRHQNFNYVNKNPTMTEHYQAMKNLADHVMQIPINTFKAAIML